MSARNAVRKLSDEERILWGEVARTVSALPGKIAPPPTAPDAAPATAPPAKIPEQPVPRPGPDPAGHHHFDAPTRKKLAKGRLPIEARVDLHDMNQAQAHGLLLSFLHRAHARGLRHVLVITGKGASFGSDGVLKRAVPVWLTTPSFRTLVSGTADAARTHGGEGALYIRLRRTTGERP